MGVGKSTVARCLSYVIRTDKIDLDRFIEECEGRSIPQIVRDEGLDVFRQMETKHLTTILEDTDRRIISLGGGAWITEKNRDLIRAHNCLTIWLESTFEHCWRNISTSRHERPLVKDRNAAQKLFDERQKVYCLADWHFVVKPDLTSYEIAQFIAEEIL